MSQPIPIHPAPAALEVLGHSPPRLARAVECWAELLTQCSADNARAFGPEEWCRVAAALNGVRWEPTAADPGALIASAVEDAGARGSEPVPAGLGDRLRALDYGHAWAFIVAVEWYWAHQEAADLAHAPWWALQYRLLFEGAEAGGA